MVDRNALLRIIRYNENRIFVKRGTVSCSGVDVQDEILEFKSP